MANLSDLQLASLLDEIACSMRVGTPVVEAMQRLQDRRLGRVAKAAGVIAAGVSRGESLSAAVAAIDSPMSEQASAVIVSCEASGDPELLERMSDQLRERSEYTRSCRLAWVYPILLSAVGYVIAVLVMGPMVRRHQGRDFNWPAWLLATAEWLDTYWYWPPVVMLAVLIVLAIWLTSRHRFSRDVRLRLFCQSLADQMTHDIPEDVAIRNAAKMSDDRQLASITQPTLQSPGVQQILSRSGSVDLAGIGQKETLIAKLRYLVSYHAERARRRNYLWSRVVPRVAMIVVGGGLIFAYTWWVIAPVYQQVARW